MTRPRFYVFMFQISVGLTYLFLMTAAIGQSTQQSGAVTVENFDRIHMQGDLHIVLEPQPKRTAAEAETRNEIEIHEAADESGVSLINVEVVDGTLYLEAFEEHSNSAREPRVVVRYSTPLRELVAHDFQTVSGQIWSADQFALEGHGHGRFELRDLLAKGLAVDCSGETNVHISGEVEVQSVNLSGRNQYHAAALRTGATQIRASGNNIFALHSRDWLDVDVHGSAVVSYLGNPWIYKTIVGDTRLFRLPEHRTTAL